MNVWLKALLVLIALALLVVVLFSWVFPWVEANILTDPTLGT